MTNFNFFNCKSFYGSGNKDLTYDCRFTVGSPSGRYCSSLLKLITVLVLVLTLGVGNVWGEDQTWNLTTNSYSSISDNEVVWSSSYVTANAVKGSGTKVNNYCPTSYSQHRLYNGNTLTITPASGYTISSIKITATGASYRIAGTWTNGTASSPSGQTYTTITPTDGTSAVSCAINAICRLTEIKVTYSAASTLSVSGNATSLAMGDAKVNGSGVTNSTLTFSGANLTANATLSITGTNASMFSVEPTSVTPTSKTITDQTISVTYNPTYAGNHTATLTIASSGATSKTITLTGTGKYEVVWKCAGSADVTTLVASGSRPTFPSTPSSCDTGEGASTTFYGWATGTWSGKATNLEDSKLSGITIYTSAASMPTVSANGTTYHAVFAKETSNYSNTTVKETFESQTASTTYNSTQIYGQSSSNAGIGWKMYYGTVSTTGALKGTKSAQMRWYKNSSSNYPYIQDTTQLLSLSKVKFKAKVGKTAVKMDVSYSTNKGDSWTKVGDAVTFANTDTITLSYDIPGADATKYLIKIGVSSSSTTPTSDYSSFQVDEVSFTYKTGSTTYSNFMTTCCTALGSINGSFNLTQSNGVLTATLPSASKNANATSYRFTLYDNSNVEITHTDVATGSGDVSTTFSSPTVSAGTTYKVSVTPLVSPQGSFCSTTGTESDKASITMHYTVTLAVNNAEYGSISSSSTLYVASGTSISASTNTLSVGATDITATYSDQTAEYTYGFTDWTWSPSGSTITANTTATANFSRSARMYNVTTTGITHATASPAIPATVAYGGSISTTITADANYTLPSAITVTGATLDNWNSSTGALSITSVTGDVSITITPTTAMKRIYMNTGGTDGGKWGADSPKFFIHSWGSSDYDVEMVAQPCASNVFYADIPEANTDLLFTRQDPSKGSSIIYKDGDGNWGQSVNITISSNNYFTFNGNWDVSSSGKSGFNAGTYTPDMKTIYLSFCAAWLENNPWFALYDVTHSTWMTTFAEVGSGCYAGYYIAQVPSCAETVLIGRFKPGTPAPFGWSGENWWGQSVDFSIGADTYDMITIEGWGTEGDAKDKGYGSLGNFALTQYSISFAGGGGTGSMSSLTNKDCGSDVTLPNVSFTKTGYDFDGWHADVDVKVGGATIPAGSTIANQATIQYIRSDVALTAQWAAKTSTVTLDNNSATSGSQQTVTATYDAAMPLTTTSSTPVAALIRTGYTFTGWWDAPSGGTQYYSYNAGTSTLSSAHTWDKTGAQTLKAQWTAKQCTVTFDKKGGSGGDNSVTATYDATMTTITPPTRSGYTFDGYWDEETDNDGSGNKYYNADGTSAATWNKNTTSETTLYAKWIAKTDTYMTAMHEGASGWTAYASGHTESGAGYTIPNPGDVAKAGTGCEGIHYHFAGWVTNANKEAGTISSNIIEATGTTDADGTTYWAVWEKESDSSTPVTYTKVTAAPSPDWGGTYLFVREHPSLGIIFNGVNAETNNYDTAVINDHTIKGSEHVYACDITIIKHANDNYYSLKNSANKYLSGTPAASGSNAILFADSDTANFEISISSNLVRIWHHGAANNRGFQVLRQKDGTGKGTFFPDSTFSFKYYNSAQQQFVLYKKTGGVIYEDPKVECVCSADPVAGTAAVDAEGTFSASSIAMKATGASTGHADCSYTDYGFVWSSSVTTPTLVEGTGAAADNCTKVPVGTDGQVTAFAGSITGSFTANTPIYVRSYVKNGKSDGTYQYSSVVTITPRSVTFNLNGRGSSAPATQLVNNGSKATDPSYSESVTGYIFGGWYKEVGCTNQWNFASDVVSGESKTLYAKWTPISYSVRFNDNDENYLGTAIGSMDNESFDYDEEKVLTTNAFSLAGYDFAGWALTADGDVAYADKASVSNLSSTNSAVVDLYAIWTAKSYDVTLAATNETSSVGSQTVTATYNAAMPTTKKGSGDVVAPSRTGYTFTGWEYSSTTYYDYNVGTSTLTSAHVWDQPNSTTTLTPKWSINSYTLTWDLAGGTVATAGTGASAGATGTPSSSVVYNSAITIPTVTKAGYNFAGWDVTPASNMPASDVTYTATWTAKTLNSISLAEASVSVYVGETKYVDVIYDPSDILTKGFTQVATPSYCQIGTYASNMQAKITGGRAGATITEDVTESVSIKANADNTKTASINVTVKPLPKVHFVDNIHNETFSDVVATIDDNTPTFIKTTPTHADMDVPGTGNSCEKTHLHLIGWIRSDYSEVKDYMDGKRDALSISEITSAGEGYWFTAGASINVNTYDGKTFYAVWAVEE